MIIKDYNWILNKTGLFMNLYCIGDVHIGSRSFLESAFGKITEIARKDKYAYFIFSGDVTDDDRPSTRILRKAMFNDRPEAFSQEDKQHLSWMDHYVIPKIKKLIRTSERCLGILDGDHYRIYSNGMTSVQYICAKLKVPYLGQGQALLRLRISYKGATHRVIRIHAHHGKGSGVTEAADIRELLNISRQWDRVNIFVRGHSHKPKVIPDNRYTDYETTPATIGTISRLLVNSGSFRGGMSLHATDYPERRNYPPTSTRCPIISFIGVKENTFKIITKPFMTEELL